MKVSDTREVSLGEWVGVAVAPNLLPGLIALFAGTWIATSKSRIRIAHAAAMASISIMKSGPYSFDTSTSVTAGAAGGVTEAKKRFRASR